MSNLASIILLVASVGVFFGYINPMYAGATGASDNSLKSIQELQTVEKDYQVALVKTSEIENVRNGLMKKRDGISAEDLDNIVKLLPDNIDSVRLIIDFNNIASEFGMSLSNILLSAPGIQTAPKGGSAGTPGAGTAGSASAADAGTASAGPDNRAYDSVKLSFSVTGTYTNFVEFLKKLEASLRIADITSLSFSSGKGGSQAPGVSGSSAARENGADVYTYSLTVRTYYLK